eukprot:103339_1
MALALLDSLIKQIDIVFIGDDDACNTLGGDIKYFYNKFSINAEKNQILKQSLQEYNAMDHENTSKSQLKELQTKYIFAYFIRHYNDKARHIICNKTNLKEFIMKAIMTKDVINKINAQTQILLSNIKNSDSKSNKYHSNCYQWTFKDAFLVELGNWFNTEFFTWYKPECNNDKCEKSGKMEYIEMVKENELKQQFGNDISRAHIYKCTQCETLEYFKRFFYCDTMIKDIKYRRGWCGEHCDAFAAIVNALDYKWRFALDDTDHIWLEIYSNDRKKWCSFEPSPETDVVRRYDYNKFADRESRYIYALNGTGEYQDVTCCYQLDRNKLQKRRNEHCVTEEWIRSFVDQEIAIQLK